MKIAQEREAKKKVTSDKPSLGIFLFTLDDQIVYKQAE